MLAHPQYVNAPVECLQPGLVGPFEFGDQARRSVLDLNIFHRHDANEPTDDKAAWLVSRLYERLEQKSAEPRMFERTPVLKNIFRRDLFERAKALVAKNFGEFMAEPEACLAHANAAG
jgi:hypothetical protein